MGLMSTTLQQMIRTYLRYRLNNIEFLSLKNQSFNFECYCGSVLPR